ncbi:MAG: hypothetical protein ISP86_05210 [Shewanellaceae bacterium]|nr:hypothetical protein [Shewanellaceae bacterium]
MAQNNDAKKIVCKAAVKMLRILCVYTHWLWGACHSILATAKFILLLSPLMQSKAQQPSKNKERKKKKTLKTSSIVKIGSAVEEIELLVMVYLFFGRLFENFV